MWNVSVVETRSSTSSCRYYGDLVVDAVQSSGYLANIVTEEQSFGSSRCPWIITAPRGQRLNISLIDFGLSHRQESIASAPGLGSGATGPVDGLGSHSAGGVCHVYAKISERGASTSDITVCGAVVQELLLRVCLSVCYGHVIQKEKVKVIVPRIAQTQTGLSLNNKNPKKVYIWFISLWCDNECIQEWLVQD